VNGFGMDMVGSIGVFRSAIDPACRAPNFGSS
jgi:hypothetical protein